MGGGTSVFCSVRAEGRSMLLQWKQVRAESEAGFHPNGVT